MAALFREWQVSLKCCQQVALHSRKCKVQITLHLNRSWQWLAEMRLVLLVVVQDPSSCITFHVVWAIMSHGPLAFGLTLEPYTEPQNIKVPAECVPGAQRGWRGCGSGGYSVWGLGLCTCKQILGSALSTQSGKWHSSPVPACLALLQATSWRVWPSFADRGRLHGGEVW